jgi:hypothetical protein
MSVMMRAGLPVLLQGMLLAPLRCVQGCRFCCKVCCLHCCDACRAACTVAMRAGLSALLRGMLSVDDYPYMYPLVKGDKYVDVIDNKTEELSWKRSFL